MIVRIFQGNFSRAAKGKSYAFLIVGLGYPPRALTQIIKIYRHFSIHELTFFIHLPLLPWSMH
jgi:hypothetical protein